MTDKPTDGERVRYNEKPKAEERVRATDKPKSGERVRDIEKPIIWSESRNKRNLSTASES